VNQVILEDQFSDAASVKRIVGDLFFNPIFETPPADFAANVSAQAAIGTYQAFVGLRKRDVNAQGAVVNFSPLDDDDDFGDAKWLRTWQHHQKTAIQLKGQLSTHSGAYPVYKPDVHTYIVPGTPACNTLATGSGTICIETTGTVDCEECDHTTEAFSAGVVSPAVWHWHIDWKRKRGCFLRENEELVLQFDFAHPQIATLAAAEPHFEVFGGIKTLMQY